MVNKRVFLGLDVGTERIGLAYGDSIARLAQPLHTLVADGSEADNITRIVHEMAITDLVVGRPRNQSGNLTAQTDSVELFSASVLKPLHLPIHWQDESVTSVVAEQRLVARKKPYTKADIDTEAAAIILQDYLETI